MRGSLNNQMQQYGNNRVSPFQHMEQMMMGFGGFNQNLFGGFGFGSMAHRDPFEGMLGFSDIHQGMHRGGQEGSFVSQTFVSSSTMGPDGRMRTKEFYENNVGQHKGGQTISQKRQAYKDSDGKNRIAEERMLNDKGRKIVKNKYGDEIEETNHYYNMDDQEVPAFDQNWERRNQETKFIANHQQYLQNAPGMRAVGNGQQRQNGSNRRQLNNDNGGRIQNDMSSASRNFDQSSQGSRNRQIQSQASRTSQRQGPTSNNQIRK